MNNMKHIKHKKSTWKRKNVHLDIKQKVTNKVKRREKAHYDATNDLILLLTLSKSN